MLMSLAAAIVLYIFPGLLLWFFMTAAWSSHFPLSLQFNLKEADWLMESTEN